EAGLLIHRLDEESGPASCSSGGPFELGGVGSPRPDERRLGNRSRRRSTRFRKSFAVSRSHPLGGGIDDRCGWMYTIVIVISPLLGSSNGAVPVEFGGRKGLRCDASDAVFVDRVR